MSLAVLPLLFALGQFAYGQSGELRVAVVDTSALPVSAAVELSSTTFDLERRIEVDTRGVAVFRGLPFGRYRVSVTHAGFAPHAEVVEVQSAVPAELRVTLTLAALPMLVQVQAGDTLVDPGQTGSLRRLGAATVRQLPTALPGRALPDLVNAQPGWLLEANGILHPRGSEYQVQVVMDGLPLTDNRSPAFAPGVDGSDVSAVTILTGGFPAEYGRKLGGVVEVITGNDPIPGTHGSVTFSSGTFGTRSGHAIVQRSSGATTASASAGASRTERYLDPPAIENYSNDGANVHASLRLDRELSAGQRAGLLVRAARSAFLVPNEALQEAAGQRQDRDAEEVAGLGSYQRVLSPRALFDVRGMGRRLRAGLHSNPMSTPVEASQARRLDELYVRAVLSSHVGRHEWKLGADAAHSSIDERFHYRITDRAAFDDDIAPSLAFADRAPGREHAVFVQDRIRFGRWTANLGVRWDRYRLVVEDSAWSPRASVAWAPGSERIVLRAAYDRVFQTPAAENLLLASAAALEGLDDDTVRLPVPPSRAHFLEVGAALRVAPRVRVDAVHYLRRIRDFADDDVLLNTGVGIPIAFDRARVRGTEVTATVPAWGRLTGTATYALMHATGEFPLTGGLFLSPDRDELESTDRFPLTQEQRHTMRGRVTWQWTPRVWTAAGVTYGSGLPFEFDADDEEAAEGVDPRILAQVDFDAGRARPSVSLDATFGLQFGGGPRRALRLQADVRNLAGRLNVINFDGLFSGTALAPPRSVMVRVTAGF